MNAIQSCADYSGLRQILNSEYPAAIDQISLHREMIGFVYFAQGRSQKYVLKLFRASESENALRSIRILQYLEKKDYPVVSIVPTRSGGTHVTIDTPWGPSVAVLFDFVEGAEPVLETELEKIGRQVGWLHRIMETCPQPLIRRGKDFYIDRYIAILRALKYPPSRIADLEDYGRELWDRMENLPAGFCHGDLHTGNMIQTGASRYTLFDFDIASRTCSMIDAATLCDASDFNRFDPAAYDRTLQVFERFYDGYNQESSMTAPEIAAMFDFIPIRHYELIATITLCQGLEILSTAFLDEQYDWLMRWKNLCDQKAPL